MSRAPGAARWAGLLLPALAACACSTDAARAERPVPQPTVTFETPTGEVTVSVEIAADPTTQHRGLMYRKSMAPLAGMLFVFPHEEEHTFWMQNTYIPLDMIFLDAQQVVVGVVAEAEPLTEDSRGVGRPSKLVVEVNAGFAARYGIGTGTRASVLGAPADTSR